MIHYECPICGSRKPSRWRLCRDCFDTYGLDQDSWPQWLVFLVADSRRWEYEFIRDYTAELYLEELDSEDTNTRGYDDCMPRAPYATEELNRQYRAANDIPE